MITDADKATRLAEVARDAIDWWTAAAACESGCHHGHECSPPPELRARLDALTGQAAEPPDPRQLAVRISTDLRTLFAQLQAPENEHAATYLRPNMLAIVELTDRLTQFAAWRTSRG